MPTKGFDPGFVGASYLAPDPQQDCQIAMNYYCETSPDPHAKTPIALLGCPGSQAIYSMGYAFRGSLVLPGHRSAVLVIGPYVYYFVNATSTLTYLGALTTTTGPVQMRSNGFSVFIVDGTWGYCAPVANGIPYNLTRITDFPGYADRIAMVDGWYAFNTIGSRNWFLSPLYYGTGGTFAPWDATAFAVADATADNIVSIIEDQRQIWLIKEYSTEIWYNAGAQFFTFQRLQGVLPQVGCAAAQTPARIEHGFIWLARNERGAPYVVQTTGLDYKRISTHAVEYAIEQYPTFEDAFAFTYMEEGHEFYVLQFPTADKTWCYDTKTELWHERGSYDPVAGQWHRHRANTLWTVNNLRYIGTNDGWVEQMGRGFYADGNYGPLVAWRRTGHIWDKESRRRLFHTQLQIELNAAGSGAKGTLSWSDDGGQTFPNVKTLTIPSTGQYKGRMVAYNLGQSRDRVYDFKISDAVRRDIVGATLMAEGEI